jgi:hypothetical protein
MIEILKLKIKELEAKKDALRGSFDEYELSTHLDRYIELKGIDYALSVLRDMLIIELQKSVKNNS